jgi:hypothetical protein
VGQSLEAQISQLTEHGCDLIFHEKISGAKTDRPQLAKLLASLQAGDAFGRHEIGQAGTIHNRPAQHRQGNGS